MNAFPLLSIRYLRQRWDRAALIVASIALGVATLVSSQTINRVIEKAADESAMPMKGAANLAITNGTAPVSLKIADDLRKANVRGVKSVQPLLFERITLPKLDDRAAVLVGVDLVNANFESSAPDAKVTFIDPLGFALGRKGLVSKAVFDAAGRGKLSLKFGIRVLELDVAGYFDVPAGSPVAALGKNVVVLEMSSACRFTHPGSTPGVNRIDIRLENAPLDVVDEIQAIVGEGGRVAVPEAASRSSKEIIDGVTTSFTLCSLGALVVGLFLVYNAMAVTIAERRPDIGVMRAVGATRGQVVKLFAGIAVVLGLFGAALGVPLGLALANLVLSEFHEVLEAIFLNPDAVPGSPTFKVILIAFLAGAGSAVLAALVPAIQAASVPPSDVVRRSSRLVGPFWLWLHRGLCAAIVSAGIAMILARHSLPHRLGSFGGMMVTLTGLLLAAPIFVSILVAVFHPLLQRILPLEARLAADNLTRSPGRTGVVIGALGAGVAVMIQTAGVGKSNEEPVMAWLQQMLRADLYVLGGSFVAGTSSQAPMEPKIVDDLRKLPGVECATGLRFARPEYNGTIVYVIAVDTHDFGTMLARRSDLPDFMKYSRASGSRVLVSENFAARHNVRPGSRITLNGANGPVSLEVADTIVDYSWSRGTVIMDRSAYATLFGDTQIDFAHVFFQPGGEKTAKASLDEFQAKNGVVAHDPKLFLEAIGGFITRFWALAYLQQVVVGVVAALGVVTALLISVLQRKRELGLLLAVGATPAQVLRSVLWEAFLMGVFGTLMGLAIGISLEWYIVDVIFFEESGFVLETLVPWREAITISVGAITIATLAGVLPAYHAVRTRITEAIAYE